MVGRNGAGKTSTLRVLAGIIPLQSGEAGCGGRVVSLLELAAGFSRDFSGRENIYLQGALYGMSKADVEARIDADHRVLRAGRVHRRPGQDLLGGDVRAAWGSRSPPTSMPTCC